MCELSCQSVKLAPPRRSNQIAFPFKFDRVGVQLIPNVMGCV